MSGNAMEEGLLLPQSFIHIAEETGFIIELSEWIVENGSCPVSIAELVVIFQELIVPQAISPNADGLNDEFIIPGISLFVERKLKVFDRWGKVVYVNGNYNNEWSGTNYEGIQLINDTYFYELILDNKTFAGFVMIKN